VASDTDTLENRVAAMEQINQSYRPLREFLGIYAMPPCCEELWGFMHGCTDLCWHAGSPTYSYFFHSDRNDTPSPESLTFTGRGGWRTTRCKGGHNWSFTTEMHPLISATVFDEERERARLMLV